MNPKEKAKELFNKYYKTLFLCETTKNIGVRCAIISVDEIINENHLFDDYSIELTKKLLSRIEYWDKVKGELYNL